MTKEQRFDLENALLQAEEVACTLVYSDSSSQLRPYGCQVEVLWNSFPFQDHIAQDKFIVIFFVHLKQKKRHLNKKTPEVSKTESLGILFKKEYYLILHIFTAAFCHSLCSSLVWKSTIHSEQRCFYSKPNCLCQIPPHNFIGWA